MKRTVVDISPMNMKDVVGGKLEAEGKKFDDTLRETLKISLGKNVKGVKDPDGFAEEVLAIVNEALEATTLTKLTVVRSKRRKKYSLTLKADLPMITEDEIISRVEKYMEAQNDDR